MRSRTRTRVAVSLTTMAIAGSVLVGAGQQSTSGKPSAQEPIGQGQTPSRFPLTQSIRERGTSVTPALEGWFRGKDGNDYFLIGYFNRNTKQEFDIPVGPNNHIDPGGPDLGQPTHFQLGRQWGVFTVKVPKDLGTKKLSWTIVANGLTNSITLHTQAEYIVEPYRASWNDNTPPVLKFATNGPTYSGPPIGFAATTFTTTLSNPLTLTAWITDEGPVGRFGAPAGGAAAGGGRDRGGRARGTPSTVDAGADFPGYQPPPRVSVTWTKFRGPGSVTFANAKPSVDDANGGRAETTASFDEAGEYVLRLQGNDSSGDGGLGEQCCWTNVHVKVTVKAATR